MKNSKLVVGALAALSLTAGQAFAEGEEEGDPCGGDPCAGDPCGGGGDVPPPDGGGMAAADGGGDDGMAGGAPSIVTPKGKLRVHVGLAVGISKDFDPVPLGGPGKPIAITPDVFYGVAPKLEAGIAHSGYALTGFWGDSSPGGVLGGGVCVTGEEGGCASVYNGPLGILARYAVMEGNIDLAVDGGFVLRALDSNGGADGGDMLMGLKVGVRGRKILSNGKMAIGFAPNVQVGLNLRDGNGDELHVPVDFHYMVNDKLGVGAQTGIQGPLDGFGENWVLPLGIGGMFMLNEKMSVGGALVLHRLTGGLPEGVEDGPGAADFRSLQLFFGWHN